ncbi:hypothetical protein KEM54_003091 [Ascosphaera aggregata]|nr:hypothetical protein KEM54_003091 [Ascosphaera aggregata]
MSSEDISASAAAQSEAEAAAAATEQSTVNVIVKSSNDARYNFNLPLSTTVLELKQKLAPEDHANCPPERQRLIYSGRVLRDPETLAFYKVKDGNTIHLVRSSVQKTATTPASPAAAAAATTTTTTQSELPQPPSYREQQQQAAARAQAQGVPTNIATGPGNDPENLFTSARYAGLFQMPGAGAFAPGGSLHMPQDPEEMARMLENPQMQSMLNEALGNPDAINAVLNHPMLPPESRPMMRMILSDPNSRRMLTDPNFIRMASTVRNAMGSGAPSFPAPGATTTTEQDNAGTASTGTPTAGASPFNPFAAGMQATNSFASLFAQPQAAAAGAAASNTGSPSPAANAGSAPALQPNPFGAGAMNGLQYIASLPPDQQMALFNQLQSMDSSYAALLGAAGAGGTNAEQGGTQAAAGNPFASLLAGLGGGSAAPQDNRPPEERYASQLSQLNDMGFFDFDRNVAALRASGGNVNGAVEYLLNHPQ